MGVLTWYFVGQKRSLQRNPENRESAAYAVFGYDGIFSVESSRLSQAALSEPETEEPAPIPNPYADWFLENDDMAAWLKVDGTVIDYPVMQTMEDETYYLRRDFWGHSDTAGCLLLDTDSDLYKAGSTNLIIHGHNMRAGTMFGTLDEYQSEDYYKEHRYMELYTKQELRRYEVMAVFYSQVYYSTDLVFKYYDFFEAQNEERFQYFCDNIRLLSLYDTGVEAEFGDRFLTLSTCSYHVEDGRFVVVCKEIEQTKLENCE